MTVHAYSISTDFIQGNGIDVSLYEDEIVASAIVPNVLGTTVLGDTVTTTFDAALSNPAETDILDGIVAAHVGPSTDADDAFVAVVIMPNEATVNSTGWTTVGTVVLDVRRYGPVNAMKVEALGMADTTSGAADIRIAWFDGTSSGAFGVDSLDTGGVMTIASHNKQPANIPKVPTEYRLQARKGAATNITMRGWVLSFIRK